MSMIELINVEKAFKGGTERVLKGVSIRFEEGKLTYILGLSGAGKSVTLKHILGLLKPDSGEVRVLGKNVGELRKDELEEYRTNFGMLFQNSALFDDMTVFENVAFPLWEHTKLDDKTIEEKVSKALTSLGMPKGYDKYPNELSGGMRKRVGLARAIIREPKILLYDEPTTGLDPITRNTVDELIETLKDRLSLTSLVISHDIPSALRLADRIAFLHQGHILFDGVPEDFRVSQHEVIRNFLDADRKSAEVILNGTGVNAQ